MAPNNIQSQEYSKDGVLDGVLDIGSVWRNLNGNRNVAVLYSDGGNRNLNLNWFENDWNADYRFAAVRN